MEIWFFLFTYDFILLAVLPEGVPPGSEPGIVFPATAVSPEPTCAGLSPYCTTGWRTASAVPGALDTECYASIDTIEMSPLSPNNPKSDVKEKLNCWINDFCYYYFLLTRPVFSWHVMFSYYHLRRLQLRLGEGLLFLPGGGAHWLLTGWPEAFRGSLPSERN